MTPAGVTPTWASEYVDLSTRFLPDDEWNWLYAHHPDLPEKSSDGCQTCGGTGTYMFGGEHPCDCGRQLALQRNYLVANIGALYHRLDWFDFDGDDEAARHASRWIERREHNLRTGRGLMFRGQFGRGKTMLSSLIAKEMVKLGVPTFFVTFAEMIEMFTRGWGDKDSKARWEEKVLNSKVLVLDDLGRDMTVKTNLPQSTFDFVLRHRVTTLRPTIITTNLTVEAMSTGYGKGVLSLLMERSNLVEVSGEDWRRKVQSREDAEYEKGWRRPVF